MWRGRCSVLAGRFIVAGNTANCRKTITRTRTCSAKWKQTTPGISCFRCRARLFVSKHPMSCGMLHLALPQSSSFPTHSRGGTPPNGLSFKSAKIQLERTVWTPRTLSDSYWSSGGGPRSPTLASRAGATKFCARTHGPPVPRSASMGPFLGASLS
jgi:hypothetical protein